VLLGLWTRLAAIPLFLVISTANTTTKLPELTHPHQGFWFMVSDARTDFAMFCSLLFLIFSGGGPGRSINRIRHSERSEEPPFPSAEAQT